MNDTGMQSVEIGVAMDDQGIFLVVAIGGNEAMRLAPGQAMRLAKDIQQVAGFAEAAAILLQVLEKDKSMTQDAAARLVHKVAQEFVASTAESANSENSPGRVDNETYKKIMAEVKDIMSA